MRMLLYPDCPFCGNSNSAISVVDVEINGIVMKGVQCNNCKKYFGLFKDFSEEIKDLKEKTDELESTIQDLEDNIK